MRRERLKTTRHIDGFSDGGTSGDGADGNEVFLRERADVVLRDRSERLIEDILFVFDIEKKARRESLGQQLQGASGARAGLSGKHDDGIGPLWIVDDEIMRRLSRQKHSDHNHDDQEPKESHLMRMLLRKADARRI